MSFEPDNEEQETSVENILLEVLSELRSIRLVLENEFDEEVGEDDVH